MTGAARHFDVQPRSEPEAHLVLPFPVSVDRDTIEKAAAALFEFVFSGCQRLDGNHHWADCSEETKAGFRREAAAVLAAVWPTTVSEDRQSGQAPKLDVERW